MIYYNILCGELLPVAPVAPPPLPFTAGVVKITIRPVRSGLDRAATVTTTTGTTYL